MELTEGAGKVGEEGGVFNAATKTCLPANWYSSQMPLGCTGSACALTHATAIPRSQPHVAVLHCALCMGTWPLQHCNA